MLTNLGRLVFVNVKFDMPAHLTLLLVAVQSLSLLVAVQFLMLLVAVQSLLLLVAVQSPSVKVVKVELLKQVEFPSQCQRILCCVAFWHAVLALPPDAST